MDVKKANRDFEILQDYLRSGQARWKDQKCSINNDGTFELYFFQYELPNRARPGRTRLRIEGPKNLYDPADGGHLHFYRNMWVADKIEVRDDQRGFRKLRRLYSPGRRRWWYVCVHGGRVRPQQNILFFLRSFDLYVKNEG